MKNLSIFDRLFLPDYRRIAWGSIIIDTEKCAGCSFCVKVCPADSIMIKDKKAQMKPSQGNLIGNPGISQCMGCGDCSAICPENAITLLKSYRWTKYYKTIERGELSPPRL